MGMDSSADVKRTLLGHIITALVMECVYAIIGDTCGCLNALPADGQYCQTISTPPGMSDWLAAKEFNILFLFQ